MIEIPKCPECSSQYAYEDRGQYVCPECGFEWSQQGSVEEDGEEMVLDANGNPLAEGDTVTVTKDLKVKGSSAVVKVGTKVKNIQLNVASDHNIDCKIEGIGAMKLKASLINSVAPQAWRRVCPQGAVVWEGWLPFKRLQRSRQARRHAPQGRPLAPIGQGGGHPLTPLVKDNQP